jgi:type I restriction enzyme M protein
VTRIVESGYNLDLKNPNAKPGLEHLRPELLLASILEKERRIIQLLDEILVELVAEQTSSNEHEAAVKA